MLNENSIIGSLQELKVIKNVFITLLEINVDFVCIKILIKHICICMACMSESVQGVLSKNDCKLKTLKHQDVD